MPGLTHSKDSNARHTDTESVQKGLLTTKKVQYRENHSHRITQKGEEIQKGKGTGSTSRGQKPESVTVH